jgi:hypothetical protein
MVVDSADPKKACICVLLPVMPLKGKEATSFNYYSYSDAIDKKYTGLIKLKSSLYLLLK